jgi:energy-coupling factor transporter ATP-binding protein EcfA2
MILTFDHVTYRYPGSETPALDDVSFELAAGEFCVLAGLSGHGKSTLLHAACGLVPHFHGGTFAGTVTLAGLDTREHGPSHLGGHAGVLFQDPETQLVMSSVRAELALALESRGQGDAAVARGVEEVALALGIDALLDRSTHELSGGEKQRVALGAALAGLPKLVLLDEPTSQLDPVAGDELIGLLRRLNEEWETTIVLAEHRLERCLGVADRVLAMERGHLSYDGDPRSFLKWAAQHEPDLQTPGAKLFALAGLTPAPTGVKQARGTLRAHGLLAEEDDIGARATVAEGGTSPGSYDALASGSEVAPGRAPSDFGDADSGSTETVSVLRQARGSAPGAHVSDAEMAEEAVGSPRRMRGLRNVLGRGEHAPSALRMKGVWHELRDGPAILRGVDLTLAPGESVALMGRNGAGKSTLLRHAAGLMEPTRGRVERAGRVALLLQNPGDYLIHERVAEEASASALAAVGLAAMAERNPKDLSGGERQRLALAIVTGGDGGEDRGGGSGSGEDGRGSGVGAGAEPPAVLALDEPTRGMDRGAKAELARDLRRRAEQGQAVIVATHDPEFAAACATRAVLLADGRVIADGPTAELLAGGWYFATETARILGGAGGALLPEQGAELLAAPARGNAGTAHAPAETAHVAAGTAHAPAETAPEAAAIAPETAASAHESAADPHPTAGFASAAPRTAPGAGPALGAGTVPAPGAGAGAEVPNRSVAGPAKIASGAAR